MNELTKNSKSSFIHTLLGMVVVWIFTFFIVAGTAHATSNDVQLGKYQGKIRFTLNICYRISFV